MKAEAGGPSKATAGLRIASPAVDQTSRACLKYCKMSSPVLDNYVERHNHLRTHVRVVSGCFMVTAPRFTSALLILKRHFQCLLYERFKF